MEETEKKALRKQAKLTKRARWAMAVDEAVGMTECWKTKDYAEMLFNGVKPYKLTKIEEVEDTLAYSLGMDEKTLFPPTLKELVEQMEKRHGITQD